MGVYNSLKNKVVIVTGGASGIGLATCKRFRDEGARVVIFDINEDEINSVLKENSDFAGGFKVDISSEKEVVEAFVKTDNKVGKVDILIANAGISIRNKFLDITYEQWNKVCDVNLGGSFLCAREAIKRMEEKKSGVVLFTASTNGMEGHPYYTDYNASKAGVILLSRTIALEYAPWLRSNSVCPGYVMTPMQRAEYTDEMIEEVNRGIPLGRHAEPEEIAALFAFLASDEASFITGQHIPICGGETA